MFLRSSTPEPLSDEDLVLRLKTGHQASLAALWDRYAHLLFGVAMKYLRDTERAKDLVTEVFGALPDLLVKHEVRTFRPWLHTLARNRCLMILRKHDPNVRLDEHVQPEQDDTEDAVLHEADLQRLEVALEQLNEGQRACIRSFYLEQLSYERTAERTSFSVEQVRSHLQNGRRNLRLLLQRPLSSP